MRSQETQSDPWVRALTDARGAIFIEVLMAFLPLFFTFLGVTQLALLKVGELVVTHAANRGVRAAVVILDDDPKHYGGVKRYDLDGGAARDQKGLLAALGKVNDSYEKLLSGKEVQGGARLTAIRQAAYHPLSVLAPPSSSATTVQDEVGASPWVRVAFVSKLYNRAAAAITVEPSGRVAPGAPVTVQVNYLMKCGVPLVSRFLCQSGGDLLKAGLGLPASERARGIMGAMQGVASPTLRDMNLATGGRYRLISASAALPNQGAEYHKD